MKNAEKLEMHKSSSYTSNLTISGAFLCGKRIELICEGESDQLGD